MKTRIRKAVSMLLVTLMIVANIVIVVPEGGLGLTAFAATSGICGENLTWILDDEGTLTISGTGNMTDFSSYSGSPWYRSRGDIKKVIIYDGVTSIGDYSLYDCSKMTSVDIPDSITSIGDSAFNQCYKLSNITLPDHLDYLGECVFKRCSNITRIVIPEGVKRIPGEGFYACFELTEVVMGSEVKHIGYRAFDGCEKLSSINIPKSVTSIEYQSGYDMYGPFYRCSSLLTAGPSNGDYNIKLDSGMTSIPNCLFFRSSLESITFPENVTSIGDRAFSSCNRLEEINIPDKVVSIGDLAFNASNNLKTVKMPNHISEIGFGVFYGCGQLVNISIPDSVVSIGQSAFYKCTSLTRINIPAHVNSIHINSASEDAFYGCNSLTEIFVSADNEQYCDMDGVLLDKQKTKLLRYPPARTGCYTIPSSINTIGACAFQGTCLSEITIPNNVNSIEDQAFYGSKSLQNVAIPESVIAIGAEAFAWCTNLTNMTIPNSISSIGGGVFYHCTNLTSVIFCNNTTRFRGKTFEGCSSLISVNIPDCVEIIEDWAFQDCSSLTNITIPNSVSSIDHSAFYGCTNMTDVYYCGSETDWAKINIGEKNKCLTNATIHYNWTEYDNFTGTFTSEADSAIEQSRKDNGIGYPENKVMTYQYEYSDEYFDGSAYDYNHDLATMSLCMAMAGYSSHNNYSNDDGILINKDSNVVDLLQNCGFESIASFNYSSPTGTDTIAACFGQKVIGDNDVLAIVIRGGNYGKEWGGNFRVGDSKLADHLGFNIAKENVYDYLIQYLNDNYINNTDYSSKNLKLWITGYSRAAATANLLAADLNMNPIDLGTTHLTINPDNMFAYTFETPLNTTRTTSFYESEVHRNIFNIINPADFVTKVAPATSPSWNFTRYGVTIRLPGGGIDSEFSKLNKAMIAEYESLTGVDFQYNILTPFRHVPEMLDTLFDDVANEVLINRNVYTMTYQSTIINLATAFLGGGLSTGERDNMIDELVVVLKKYGRDVLLQRSIDYSSYYNELADIVVKYIGDASDNEEDCIDKINIDLFVTMLLRVVGDYAFENEKASADINADTTPMWFFIQFPTITHMHEPTVCLSWMRSLADNEEWLSTYTSSDYSSNRKMYTPTAIYRKAYINCPVDITVTDENGSIVASIVNDIPNIPDGSEVSAYVDSNGQKVICMPTDKEYSIKIIATDNGEMTYMVTEYSMDYGENRVVSYYDVPLSEGITYEGVIENLSVTDNAEYPLSTEYGEKVEVTNDVAGDNIVWYTASATTDGNGYTTESQTVIKGQYVQFNAIAEENNKFSGWYINNELVSTESSYRFQVDNDVEIVAKFEAIPLIVTPESLTMLPDESQSLIVSASSDSIVWTSNNEAVATVDSNGKVTAHALGTVTITATAGDITGSCTIEVVPPISLTAMGGSVRIVEPYGLRFGIQLKKDAAFNEYKDIIVSYGTLIIPKKTLSEVPLTFEVEKAMDVPAVNIYSEDSTQLTYTGVLVGIPKSAFYSDIVGRGYLKYFDVDGNEKVMYTDEIVRSYYQVANSAYTRYGNIADRNETEQAVYEKLSALLAEMTDGDNLTNY